MLVLAVLYRTLGPRAKRRILRPAVTSTERVMSAYGQWLLETKIIEAECVVWAAVAHRLATAAAVNMGPPLESPFAVNMIGVGLFVVAPPLISGAVMYRVYRRWKSGTMYMIDV